MKSDIKYLAMMNKGFSGFYQQYRKEKTTKISTMEVKATPFLKKEITNIT